MFYEFFVKYFVKNRDTFHDRKNREKFKFNLNELFSILSSCHNKNVRFQ